MFETCAGSISNPQHARTCMHTHMHAHAHAHAHAHTHAHVHAAPPHVIVAFDAKRSAPAGADPSVMSGSELPRMHALLHALHALCMHYMPSACIACPSHTCVPQHVHVCPCDHPACARAPLHVQVRRQRQRDDRSGRAATPLGRVAAAGQGSVEEHAAAATQGRAVRSAVRSAVRNGFRKGGGAEVVRLRHPLSGAARRGFRRPPRIPPPAANPTGCPATSSDRVSCDVL